jgi:hypothetical protein
MTFTGADGTATIITSANTVTVELFSTNGNPKSDGSELTGITFNLSGSHTGDTLASASAPDGLIDIASGGGVTSDSGSITHWGTSLNGSLVCLETVGPSMGGCQKGGQPFDMIIGPGPYTNANPSITGKDPQIEDEGIFVLTIMGVNVDTTVSNVMLETGTSGTSFEPGTLGNPSVPEPSSLLLFGTGVLGVAGALRRKIFARN